MTNISTISLFGFPLIDADPSTALDALLSAPGRQTAAFLNAHCVNTAAADRAYAQALRGADALLPDGSGMSLAAKMIGRRFTANLNGTDLFAPLVRAAAQRGKSVYFLGGRPGVAEGAAAKARALAPGLRIAGCHHGFFGASGTDAVVEKINASGADILLVAMGVPLQDVWIYRHRRRINAGLAMGVGALFDFQAGVVSRAPKPLRRAGLEWTWRLAIEPRRMFRRYVLGNPAFVVRAARNAMRTRVQAAPRPMSGGKRALDVAITAAAMLALAPVFAATAAAVRLTSPGPVIFRQTRVGLNGEEFTMYKFRSMHADAEARRAALLQSGERDGICFKSSRDPRITPVGRFIRRYSLDELPQLVNVLKGNMSLVGPRPGLPSEVRQYSAHDRKRLQAVPGITGLWQVSGRAEIGFDQMVEMDIAYTRRMSVWRDLFILGRTARAVLSGRGAY